MISIDGLDYSGKSTCAKIISDLTGFKYTKIKKGSLLDYSFAKTEEEITRTIVDEISEGVGNNSEIVLDRSYLSALLTGRIYDPSLNMDLLLQHIPQNLSNPRLGLIVTVPHEVAISRINGRMTNQDRIILNSNYATHQELLQSVGQERGYVVFNNGSNQTEKELKKSLENLLTKYFY